MDPRVILSEAVEIETNMIHAGILVEQPKKNGKAPPPPTPPTMIRTAKTGAIMVTVQVVERPTQTTAEAWLALPREARQALDKQQREAGKRKGFDGKWQKLCSKCNQWDNRCQCAGKQSAAAKTATQGSQVAGSATYTGCSRCGAATHYARDCPSQKGIIPGPQERASH